MTELYKLYNNTVTLKFDEGKHVYEVNGQRVLGVTGVCGVINKPALMYWSVNMAVEYLARNLKAGKSYDEIEIKQLLEKAKYAHRNVKKEAGDIGTLVHEAVDKYAKTGIITPLVNTKAKTSLEQFIKWSTDNKVRFIENEIKVYSKKLGYAGTMDFYCQMGEKFFVGDTKTSSGIYDEMWFQTAAYQQAYQEETGDKVDGHLIVRVGRDGSIEVKENYEYEKNITAFNGALVLYRRIEELNDIRKGNGK